MYQIRDMDENIRKQCLDMMQEKFLIDEPISQILEPTKDPVSVAEIRQFWEDCVSQNLSLACFTEEDGEPKDLVGFNVIYLKSKDDKEDFHMIQGECLKRFIRVRTQVFEKEMCDVFQHYNVAKFLTSSGLIVVPEHRGQNIGARILEAREPLCKALGIEATATIFSATASQILASKCGYELLTELKYSDLIKYGIDLTGCSTPTVKYMGKMF